MKSILYFDKKLIRSAVKSYWMRTVGGLFPMVLMAMAIATTTLYAQGQRTLLLGVMALTTVLGLISILSLYVVHLKNTTDLLEKMGEPNASFQVEEKSFTLASEIGSSTLRWSVVTELWRFQETWLFMYSKGSYSILPLVNIPEEMQAFIITKVTQAGGKIK